jgi:hypothetical protein
MRTLTVVIPIYRAERILRQLRQPTTALKVENFRQIPIAWPTGT